MDKPNARFPANATRAAAPTRHGPAADAGPDTALAARAPAQSRSAVALAVDSAFAQSFPGADYRAWAVYSARAHIIAARSAAKSGPRPSAGPDISPDTSMGVAARLAHFAPAF